MKTKKEFFLLAFGVLFFTAQTVNAQVTIGSELEPSTGALLDLKENSGGTSTKGFQLPRVALTSLTSLAPCYTGTDATVIAKHWGLQVYNTNPTIGEGVYTWNGERWTTYVFSESCIVLGAGSIPTSAVRIPAESSIVMYTNSITQEGWYLVSLHSKYIKENTSGHGIFSLNLSHGGNTYTFYRQADFDVYQWLLFANASRVVYLTQGSFSLTASAENSAYTIPVKSMEIMFMKL